MRSALLVLVALALLPGAAAVSPPGTDLVNNSGFETWVNGSPTDWTAPDADWSVEEAGGSDGSALRLETTRYATGYGVMRSTEVPVEEGDRFLATGSVSSRGAVNTRVLFRGWNADRETWETLQRFDPAAERQHVFLEVPENHTKVRVALYAGYAEDRGRTASSTFDDLRLIEPSVDGADAYREEAWLSGDSALSFDSFRLELEEVNGDTALVTLRASSSAVYDTKAVRPGDAAVFGPADDPLLAFSVDEVFRSTDGARCRVTDLVVAEEALGKHLAERGYTYGDTDREGMVLNLELEGEDAAFDGETDALIIPDADALDAARTVMVEVNPGAERRDEVWYHVLASKDDGFDRGLYLDYHASPNRFAAVFGNGSDSSVASWDIPRHDRTYVVTGVLDGNRSRLYVGSELVDTGPPVTAPVTRNEEPLRVGGGLPNRYSNVTLRSVRLYDRALTPEEINAEILDLLGVEGNGTYLGDLDPGEEPMPVGTGFHLAKRNGTLVLYEGTVAVDTAAAPGDVVLSNGEGIPVLTGTYAEGSLRQAVRTDAAARAPDLELTAEARGRVPDDASVTVRVRNTGDAALPGGAVLTVTLEGEVLATHELNPVPAGSSVTASVPVARNRTGTYAGEAELDTGVFTLSRGFRLELGPPVNPAVRSLTVDSRETGDGVRVRFDLGGDAEDARWTGDASVTLRRESWLGTRTVHRETVEVDGTSGATTIPFDAFYTGDGAYLAEARFRGAVDERAVRVTGPDGDYDPGRGARDLLLLLSGVLALAGVHLWRRE